jgi:hypothetical protein
VGEHVEQREAGAQVFVDHVGAPDLMRAAFAQAEQAGGVVDLAVHQDDGADAGVAQGAAGCIGAKLWSWARMSGEALHSTQLTPSSEIAMDDWVRAWHSGCRRETGAVHAVAVPLGKPPPAAEPRIWTNMAAPSFNS